MGNRVSVSREVQLLGDVYNAGYHKDFRATSRGIEAAHLNHRRFSRVAVADPDGFAEAQAVAAAGDLTLDGTLVTDGVGVVDDPKCVQINTNTATNNTQTLTVYGTDEYNVPMLERLAFNGTTAAYGTKAFKTVTRAEVSAALAGTVTVGTSDILGLPFALRDLEDVVSFNIDGLGAGDPVPLVGSPYAIHADEAPPIFTDTSIVLPTGGWVKLVGSIGAKYFSVGYSDLFVRGAYSGGRWRSSLPRQRTLPSFRPALVAKITVGMNAVRSLLISGEAALVDCLLTCRPQARWKLSLPTPRTRRRPRVATFAGPCGLGWPRTVSAGIPCLWISGTTASMTAPSASSSMWMRNRPWRR